jgi:hypothetical protein
MRSRNLLAKRLGRSRRQHALALEEPPEQRLVLNMPRLLEIDTRIPRPIGSCGPPPALAMRRYVRRSSIRCITLPIRRRRACRLPIGTIHTDRDAEWISSAAGHGRSVLPVDLVAVRLRAVSPALAQRDWPGNVRELRNAVERTALQVATVTTRKGAAPFDFDGGAPVRAVRERSRVRVRSSSRAVFGSCSPCSLG